MRLIVCRRVGTRWLGSTASFGGSRIQIEGLAPIELAEEIQPFDCVHSRYDGSTFWFDELDPRHDPATAAYLRSALSRPLAPDELQRPGLTAEERAAYELNYWQLVEPPPEEPPGGRPRRNPLHRRRSRKARPGSLELASETDPACRRLRESLSHAGARLVDYLERSDSFRVTYRIGGRQYTSSIAKTDLTVQAAGICLSGEDRKFDLGSLVGVLREAEQGGEIVPVGDDNDGIDEEDDWQVHPPQDR